MKKVKPKKYHVVFKQLKKQRREWKKLKRAKVRRKVIQPKRQFKKARQESTGKDYLEKTLFADDLIKFGSVRMFFEVYGLSKKLRYWQGRAKSKAVLNVLYEGEPDDKRVTDAEFKFISVEISFRKKTSIQKTVLRLIDLIKDQAAKFNFEFSAKARKKRKKKTLAIKKFKSSVSIKIFGGVK